jgi:BlaI family transcriptional regulator, penicillinase repressor
MSKSPLPPLSRRERQIMDILYQRGQATAAVVQADLPDAPSYSTVRTLLRVLKDKGHVQQRVDGPRYVYSPTVPPQKAKRRALQNLIATFFEGSAEKALATLVDMASTKMSRAELDQLRALIDRANEGDKQ